MGEGGDRRADEGVAARGWDQADRGLAHDLRNLLTAIDGHAQLARAALADDHPAREDLEEVLAAASRARQMTEAWLAGPSAAVAPMPLDDLVRGALPLLAAVVGPRARVEVALAAPHPVRIGRLRLERVLLNLCLNARDAMLPEGGPIGIATATREDGRVEVRVEDAGPGIDQAVVERLLGLDGRAADARAADARAADARADGHGLGLRTSRALLLEAGGALEVEAVAGRGTTMRAILPLAIADA